MHTNIITPSKDYVTQGIYAATGTQWLANTPQYAGYSIRLPKEVLVAIFFTQQQFV